jgi:hypothetical protein
MPSASPYATALAMGRAKPTYIKNVDDLARVTAYWTYDDIYSNVAEVFLLTLRDDTGDEMSRRLVPSARTIVEATNRYLAREPMWVASAVAPSAQPDAPAVAGEIVTQARLMIEALFKREEFISKFMSMKRWMLVRGDGLFHITVDENKEPGTRLRITELDPSTYFPIYDPVDSERVIGCHLVNVVLDDAEQEIVQRLTYMKTPTGAISIALGYFTTDGWDDRTPLSAADLKVVPVPEAVAADQASERLMTGFELPALIKAIPVYHFKNIRRGSHPFGISEIQGLETLINGVNQTATDEDIAIALQGLGFYWTDSGKPRDEHGNEVDWVVAPATMAEVEPGRKIGRVEGATNIESSQRHIDMMKREMQETSATPQIAVGRVDVSVASSGVALAIEMQPILAKNAEKELELAGQLNHLLFDLLNAWLPTYEGFNGQGVEIEVEFSDPLPMDRAAVLKEILDMLTAKVISIEFAQQVIHERLGYNFPVDMLQQLMNEQQQLLDQVGARLDAAAAGTGGQPVGG